jgi:hypothetical protein
MVSTSDTNKIILPQPENSTQYQLVTFMVAIPTQTPTTTSETQGRPFEFVEDKPSKFSVMCPFCCAGLYVDVHDITEKYGYKFISCSECNAGKPEPVKKIPAMPDPFVNPFSSKQLNRCELDETVTPIDSIQDDGSLTVAQKMSRVACTE